MNKNIQRAHFCNVYDLEYRLASTLIAGGLTPSSSDSRLINFIINKIISEFKCSFQISQSFFCEVFEYCCQNQLIEKYPGLASEIAWSSCISPSNQLDILINDYRLMPTTRLLARIKQLKRKLGEKSNNKCTYYSQYDLSEIFPIFSSSKESFTIHVSPYQSMSFGHMIFYAYAIAFADTKPASLVKAWVKREYCASQELLEILGSTFSNFDICEDLWAMTQGTAQEILNTDALFHFMHFLYPIRTISTMNNVTQKIRSKFKYRESLGGNPRNIFCHVRTPHYKNDDQDKNARIRNSNPIFIIEALQYLFSDSHIFATSPPLTYNQTSPNISFECIDSESGRANQIEHLALSQYLVAPTSGFTLFANYGPQKLWFYNATCLLASYPIPSTHFISPKKLIPKKSLRQLSKKKLALFLLDDWNQLYDYCDIQELSYDELVREGKLAKMHLFSIESKRQINICEYLGSYLDGFSLSSDLCPRNVSYASFENIYSLFVYISA